MPARIIGLLLSDSPPTGPTRAAMQQAFEAHDAALVSAIAANGAALKLLNRMMDEGLDK